MKVHTLKEDQYRHLNPYAHINLVVTSCKETNQITLNWLDNDSKEILLKVKFTEGRRVVHLYETSLIDILIEDAALILAWELGYHKQLKTSSLLAQAQTS